LEELSGHGVYLRSERVAAQALAGLRAGVMGPAILRARPPASGKVLRIGAHDRSRSPDCPTACRPTGRRNFALPMIKVHLNTEVVGGSRRRTAGIVTVRNRMSGQEQHLPLESLSVMIGATPRTDWLPTEVEHDPHGFLYTGAEAAACVSWTLERSPHPHETSVPDCSQSATCESARSNGWHPRSARGRSLSPKFTSSSPYAGG
jgi:hypothetical protein